MNCNAKRAGLLKTGPHSWLAEGLNEASVAVGVGLVGTIRFHADVLGL
jgi:hypothetical protein